MSCVCRTSKIWSRQSAPGLMLGSAFISLPSKRLYDHEEHDSDHQDRRHLVPDAIEAGRPCISVGLEILAPAAVGVMNAGHHQDKHDFGLEPARTPPITLPSEQQAQDPDCALRRL